MECILTEEELRERCNYWQKVLRHGLRIWNEHWFMNYFIFILRHFEQKKIHGKILPKSKRLTALPLHWWHCIEKPYSMAENCWNKWPTGLKRWEVC